MRRTLDSACTIACSALIAKFNTTCCSSVKIAITSDFDRSSSSIAMPSSSSLRWRSSMTDATTSRRRTGVGSEICRPNRDRFRMIALARALSF